MRRLKTSGERDIYGLSGSFDINAVFMSRCDDATIRRTWESEGNRQYKDLLINDDLCRFPLDIIARLTDDQLSRYLRARRFIPVRQGDVDDIYAIFNEMMLDRPDILLAHILDEIATRSDNIEYVSLVIMYIWDVFDELLSDDDWYHMTRHVHKILTNNLIDADYVVEMFSIRPVVAEFLMDMNDSVAHDALVSAGYMDAIIEGLYRADAYVTLLRLYEKYHDDVVNAVNNMAEFDMALAAYMIRRGDDINTQLLHVNQSTTISEQSSMTGQHTHSLTQDDIYAVINNYEGERPISFRDFIMIFNSAQMTDDPGMYDALFDMVYDTAHQLYMLSPQAMMYIDHVASEYLVSNMEEMGY